MAGNFYSTEQQKWRQFLFQRTVRYSRRISRNAIRGSHFRRCFGFIMQFFVIIMGWSFIGTLLPAIQGRLQALKQQRAYNQHLLNVVNDRISSLRSVVQLEQERVPVIIGFAPDTDGVRDTIASRLSQFVRRKFRRINAISALVTQSELDDLKQNSDVLYVEEDVMVYPDDDDSEPTLYGLKMVQAFSPIIPI
jgi:hypothetical protein